MFNNFNNFEKWGTMPKQINVLLLCYTGASSSYFVEKMKEEAEKRKVDIDIEYHTVSPFPTDFSKYNIILVAPQVKHTMEQVQKIVEKSKTLLIPLDFQTFGLCEGGKVLDQVLTMLDKKKWSCSTDYNSNYVELFNSKSRIFLGF